MTFLPGRIMSGAPWPERDAELIALWNEGLSTAGIGARMALTKNQIVGRSHRLKLPSRPSPIRCASPATVQRRIIQSAIQHAHGVTLPPLQSERQAANAVLVAAAREREAEAIVTPPLLMFAIPHAPIPKFSAATPKPEPVVRTRKPCGPDELYTPFRPAGRCQWITTDTHLAHRIRMCSSVVSGASSWCTEHRCVVLPPRREVAA